MQIRSVVADVFPYDRGHDLYQESYRLSLEAFCHANGLSYTEESHSHSSGLLRKLRSVRYSYKLNLLIGSRLVPIVVDFIAQLFSKRPVYPPDWVGAYVLTTESGEKMKIGIDATDSGALCSKEIDSFDLYFKTNFWPTHTYPANVVPLPNVNPLVYKNLPYFLGKRKVKKTIDLFAFIRVWGGTDEVEGIEHNLSLIEQLAKIPCTKYLCAYLVAGDIPSIAARLERQGIAWTTQPMAKPGLWERAAEARLNIVRLGMHECIPWRMTDILAIGGCPVIDYGPQTIWPAALVENRHFLNLHTGTGEAFATDIAEKTARWLATPGLIEEISRNTADYFDTNLKAEMLGGHILTTIEERRARKHI